MRCRIAGVDCPGGSTAVVIRKVPLYMFSPTRTWAGTPPARVSATAKISPRPTSTTGVPVMPTVGLMSPAQARSLFGTGVPTWVDHRTAPVLAANA